VKASSRKAMIFEKIFDFAYVAALGDAVNQKAYSGEKTVLQKNREARDIVKKYIDDIIAGRHPDFYSTANAVENSFADFLRKNSLAGSFTFGNTQKLINMTVKHMYRVAYVKPELRENFKGCHCPMDNIMTELVKNKIAACAFAELPCDIQLILNRKGWRGELCKPWSKISEDKTQYLNFQRIVAFLAEKEGAIPIEYDYIYWLAE
jgi:hypothetical protein